MSRVGRRLRIAILERDGYRCAYCGRGPTETMLEVDHVLPRALGGGNEPANLVTACTTCNGGKSIQSVALPPHVVLDRPLPGWFTDPIRRPMPTRRRIPRSAPDLVLCDLCREPANTAHFVPWVSLPREDPGPDVLFACYAHDPGGYWIDLAKLNLRQHPWMAWDQLREHISQGTEGARAVSRLNERLAGDSPRPITHATWRQTDTEIVVKRWPALAQ